VLKGVNHNRTK